jgi:leader peptidase (prepilin peptidase) / N-methyltransferase
MASAESIGRETASPAVVAPLRPRHAVAAAVVALPVAAAVLARSDPSFWSAVAAAAAGVLVWVAAIDLETRLLPNRIVLPATGVVLAASVALGPGAFAEHALASLGAGGFLFVAASVRPGDLGMGDVKLALLLGALLGRSVATAVTIGLALVLVPAVFQLARQGRAGLRTHIPLGPFLAAGAVVTLLVHGAS